MIKKNMKMNKKKKKKISLAYYTRKIIYCERLEATEDNKLIRVIYLILQKYYTYKWERYFDEK